MDLLPHTAVRWLNRHKTLHLFFPLLEGIKAFVESREADTTLLSGSMWLLELVLLTDVTKKQNHLNLQLQEKDKNTCDMTSSAKAFKGKLSFTISK